MLRSEPGTEREAHLPLISVTRAGKLFGLTSRAIRYYEELGLVRAHRDKANVRSFDDAGRRRLEWIARLRRAVPLHEIAEVLRLEDGRIGAGRDLALQHLERRRVRLEDELANLEALMTSLRSRPSETALQPPRKPGPDVLVSRLGASGPG